MNKMPLVSIIMPTYNRSDLLPRAIASVLNQTYENWELLIIDDNSTDDTINLVSKFKQKDVRIKYIKNSRAKGPSGGRNVGLINARGTYFAFLDSDDEWTSIHLSQCINALLKENLKVCFGLWKENHAGKEIAYDDFLQEKGINLKKRCEELGGKIKNNIILWDRNFFEYTLLGKVYCYHINSMVIHRDVFNNIGLFDEKLRTSGDMDYTFRIFYEYEFCLIYDYHFIYYEGTDNLYMFMDRDTANIYDIINDKKIVDKLTFHGVMKNRVRQKNKKMVKTSRFITNKKGCIKFLNKRIGDKFFALGFLNHKYNKWTSLKFYIKSLFYKFDTERIKILILLLQKNDKFLKYTGRIDIW